MKGFDDRFDDFPDYILKTSMEIWEGRGLGAAMGAIYHPDVILRRADGMLFGQDAVAIAATETLASLPDLVLLGEDVIWSGAPEVGMLAAHRVLAQARHSRDGLFGPATGARLTFRTLSESYAKANRISDVWTIRDTGAILRQTGRDVRDFTRDRLARLDPETQPFRPAVDVQGPYTGRGNDNRWGGAFAALLDRIMAGDIAVLHDQYDRAVQAEHPGGVTAHGTADVEAFWLGLRAAFPSARFDVHHQIGMEDPNMPPRAAIRWSLTGRHDGWGAFGPPTGALVHVMGMSHAEFGPRGLRREWTLYDETAIWTQILAHVG